MLILKEISFVGHRNKTYCKANKSCDELTDENTENTRRFCFKVTEKKTQPIMYWTPKMHKNLTGARFIIASKICSTKQISKSVSNIFKLIYSQIEDVHKDAKFLSNYKKMGLAKMQIK